MLERIKQAYEQLLGHGNIRLGAYRCCMFVNGVQCNRTELSKRRIILHLAVEHGVRRMTKEQIDGIEVQQTRR